MGKGRDLARGGAWLAAANVLENVGLLVVNLAVIRAYGAEGHGHYVLGLSLVSLLRLACDAGLGPALTRLLAGGAGRPALGRAAVLALVLNLPAALAVGLAPGLFAGAGGDHLRAFAPWLAAMAAQGLAAAAFNGVHAMHLSFAASALFEAAKLGSVAWLLLARPDLPDFLLVLNLSLGAAGAACALLLSAAAARLTSGPSEPPAPPPPSWPALLRLSLVLWVPASAPALSQAVNLVLGARLSGREVSHFAILATWSVSAAVVLSPVANAFFAWSARHGGGSADAGTADVRAAYFRLLGAASLGAAALLAAGSGPLLSLYGGEYRAWRPLFLVLLLANLAEYPRYLTAPLLGSGARTSAALRMESARTAAALAAASMAAPFGLTAVGWAFLALQAAFGLLRLVQARDDLGFAPFDSYARVAAAGAAAILPAFLPVPPAAAIAAPLAVALGAAVSARRALRRRAAA